MPISLRRSLARRLAPRLLKRNCKRRRIIDVNLHYCFPELSPLQRKARAHAFAERWLFSVLDGGRLWAGARRDLDKRVRIEGGQHLDAAIALRSPVMLLVPHTVGLEHAALYLARHYPMLGLTRETGADLGSWALRRLRKRYADCVLDRNTSMRKVIAGLKSGRVLYYLPDEDHGARRRSIFVPYFGRNTSTVLGSGRLVAICKAKLLPCVTHLDVETGIYTVRISPPIGGLNGEAPETICAVIRRELERLIRSAPDDYLWSLRMFQTLETGERNSDYAAAAGKASLATRLARQPR